MTSLANATAAGTDAAPIANTPDHWIQDHFLVDGRPVHYYVARSKEERGVIVGCSGLKSNNPLSVEAVQAYNDAGISIIMMALPNPARDIGFMPHFRKVFERFALDENSPVHALFPKELPKFLYGHSTGGLLALRTLTKTALFNKFEEMGYKKSLLEAPFSDTANASLHYSAWLGRTIFNAYACWHRNKLPKETLGGLWYLHHSENKIKLHRDMLNAPRRKRASLYLSHIFNTTVEALRDKSDFRLSQINKNFSNTYFVSKLPLPIFLSRIPLMAAYILHSNVNNLANAYMLRSNIKPTAWFLTEGDRRTPTYGQILEDQYAGRKYYTRLNKVEKPQTSIPTTIVASNDDPFSCTKTTENKIATPLQADFREAEGLHNPLSEDTETLEYSINQITPYLLDTPIRNEAIERAPSRWSLFTSSSNLCRSAGQSAAGFLNAAAGFTQGAFRSSVGNAEMGREPEGRAGDASNAFSPQ